MIRAEDDDFVYSFEARETDDGKTVWHCEVCRRGDAVPLMTSINLTSRVAAQEEATRR